MSSFFKSFLQEKKFELAYYTDDSKKGKCQYVDFENFVAIKPSVSAGRREHCFAIELRKKTYVLQAGDFQVKNLWVAKLCEVLRKGATTHHIIDTLFICYVVLDVYHVGIPHQAQLPPGHGLLKILKAETVIVCPSTNKTLATFRLKSLKRFGTCNDILWLEVCPCTNDNAGLYFFSVGSGINVCDQIANTIKNLLQNLTKQHLVFNNSGSEGPNFSAPKHYSCPGAAPLSQVSFIASMRKTSIVSVSSAAPKQRKYSASSTFEESCGLPQRSTTFSQTSSTSNMRHAGPLMKQPSITSYDGTSRTTLSNFRQASILSLEGSTPLSKFRQGSIDNSSIPESPSRNRSGSSAVKNAERKDSGVFDEEGLAQAMSKVSVSPQNSDSSSERVTTTVDSPGISSSGPYVNYYAPSQPLSSPSVSDSPPISPQATSLSTVPEQPMSIIKEPSQVPPVAPPRSLISLLGSSSSSKC